MWVVPILFELHSAFMVVQPSKVVLGFQKFQIAFSENFLLWTELLCALSERISFENVNKMQFNISEGNFYIAISGNKLEWNFGFNKYEL